MRLDLFLGLLQRRVLASPSVVNGAAIDDQDGLDVRLADQRRPALASSGGKSGMMNFESIFTKAYENGLDEYFVEIEGLRDGMTQFEGVEQCYNYIDKAKFVK